MTRPAVLVIAATDSSGGAGLTRDVQVLRDFGIDALCAVTAVTAQSDQRVARVHHVPAEVVRAQIAAALGTRPVDAVKIGMLGDRATVEAVAESLAQRGSPDRPERLPQRAFRDGPAGPVVIDPVLVSSSGGMLLDAPGRAALLQRLVPLATLVTPNVPEVAALLGEAVATDEASLVRQGERLLGFGCQAILLKGGHASGEAAVDLLITPRNVERITASRVSGSSRGTGCALASGIAAGLASGLPLLEACRRAKSYVLERMLTRAGA
jgi:hydroxymethylpyrimidine/phosphomethylpyrimidine kinase